MAGKKAHKPKNLAKDSGTKGIHKSDGGKAGFSQTPGQSERDPKRRRGQYGGAGDAPLIKK